MSNNTKSTVESGNTSVGQQNQVITNQLVVKDPDGLSNPNFKVKTNPENGTASIDPATGEWVYKPNTNFYGKDKFLVTLVDDAGWTSTQYVFVTVNQTPQKPAKATGGNNVIGEEGDILSAKLTVEDQNGIENPNFQIRKEASNGSATIDSSTGEWTYEPNEGFVGNDHFLVQVTDNLGFTSTMYVHVTLNPATVTEEEQGAGGFDLGLEDVLVQADQSEESVLAPSFFSAPQAINLPVEEESAESNEVEGFESSNDSISNVDSQTAVDQYDSSSFINSQDVYKDLLEPTIAIV